MATYEEMQRHMMRSMPWPTWYGHTRRVDPRIYNLADEMGMLLWVEVLSPHSSSHRSRENHWPELLRMLALIEIPSR